MPSFVMTSLRAHRSPLICLGFAILLNIVLQLPGSESAFNRFFARQDNNHHTVSRFFHTSHSAEPVCGTQQHFELPSPPSFVVAAITSTTFVSFKSKTTSSPLLPSAAIYFLATSFVADHVDLLILYKSELIYRYSGLAPPLV